MKEFSDIWRKIDEKSTFINDADRKLLKACHKHYQSLAVRCKHPVVPISLSFPFNPGASIIGKPRHGKGIIKKKTRGGSSHERYAIWEIVEKLGMESDCGNEHQSQLKNAEHLTPSAYNQIEGEWYYCVHNDVIQKIAKTYGI